MNHNRNNHHNISSDNLGSSSSGPIHLDQLQNSRNQRKHKIVSYYDTLNTSGHLSSKTKEKRAELKKRQFLGYYPQQQPGSRVSDIFDQKDFKGDRRDDRYSYHTHNQSYYNQQQQSKRKMSHQARKNLESRSGQKKPYGDSQHKGSGMGIGQRGGGYFDGGSSRQNKLNRLKSMMAQELDKARRESLEISQATNNEGLGASGNKYSRSGLPEGEILDLSNGEYNQEFSTIRSKSSFQTHKSRPNRYNKTIYNAPNDKKSSRANNSNKTNSEHLRQNSATCSSTSFKENQAGKDLNLFWGKKPSLSKTQPLSFETSKSNKKAQKPPKKREEFSFSNNQVSDHNSGASHRNKNDSRTEKKDFSSKAGQGSSARNKLPMPPAGRYQSFGRKPEELMDEEEHPEFQETAAKVFKPMYDHNEVYDQYKKQSFKIKKKGLNGGQVIRQSKQGIELEAKFRLLAQDLCKNGLDDKQKVKKILELEKMLNRELEKIQHRQRGDGASGKVKMSRKRSQQAEAYPGRRMSSGKKIPTPGATKQGITAFEDNDGSLVGPLLAQSPSTKKKEGQSRRDWRENNSQYQGVNSSAKKMNKSVKASNAYSRGRFIDPEVGQNQKNKFPRIRISGEDRGQGGADLNSLGSDLVNNDLVSTKKFDTREESDFQRNSNPSQMIALNNDQDSSKHPRNHNNQLLAKEDGSSYLIQQDSLENQNRFLMDLSGASQPKILITEEQKPPDDGSADKSSPYNSDYRYFQSEPQEDSNRPHELKTDSQQLLGYQTEQYSLRAQAEGGQLPQNGPEIVKKKQISKMDPSLLKGNMFLQGMEQELRKVSRDLTPALIKVGGSDFDPREIAQVKIKFNFSNRKSSTRQSQGRKSGRKSQGTRSSHKNSHEKSKKRAKSSNQNYKDSGSNSYLKRQRRSLKDRRKRQKRSIMTGIWKKLENIETLCNEKLMNQNSNLPKNASSCMQGYQTNLSFEPDFWTGHSESQFTPFTPKTGRRSSANAFVLKSATGIVRGDPEGVNFSFEESRCNTANKSVELILSNNKNKRRRLEALEEQEARFKHNDSLIKDLEQEVGRAPKLSSSTNLKKSNKWDDRRKSLSRLKARQSVEAGPKQVGRGLEESSGPIRGDLGRQSVPTVGAGLQSSWGCFKSKEDSFVDKEKLDEESDQSETVFNDVNHLEVPKEAKDDKEDLESLDKYGLPRRYSISTNNLLGLIPDLGAAQGKLQGTKSQPNFQEAKNQINADKSTKNLKENVQNGDNKTDNQPRPNRNFVRKSTQNLILEEGLRMRNQIMLDSSGMSSAGNSQKSLKGVNYAIEDLEVEEKAKEGDSNPWNQLGLTEGTAVHADEQSEKPCKEKEVPETGPCTIVQNQSEAVQKKVKAKNCSSQVKTASLGSNKVQGDDGESPGAVLPPQIYSVKTSKGKPRSRDGRGKKRSIKFKKPKSSLQSSRNTSLSTLQPPVDLNSINGASLYQGHMTKSRASHGALRPLRGIKAPEDLFGANQSSRNLKKGSEKGSERIAGLDVLGDTRPKEIPRKPPKNEFPKSLVPLVSMDSNPADSLEISTKKNKSQGKQAASQFKSSIPAEGWIKEYLPSAATLNPSNPLAQFSKNLENEQNSDKNKKKQETKEFNTETINNESSAVQSNMFNALTSEYQSLTTPEEAPSPGLGIIADFNDAIRKTLQEEEAEHLATADFSFVKDDSGKDDTVNNLLEEIRQTEREEIAPEGSGRVFRDQEGSSNMGKSWDLRSKLNDISFDDQHRESFVGGSVNYAADFSRVDETVVETTTQEVEQTQEVEEYYDEYDDSCVSQVDVDDEEEFEEPEDVNEDSEQVLDEEEDQGEQDPEVSAQEITIEEQSYQAPEQEQTKEEDIEEEIEEDFEDPIKEDNQPSNFEDTETEILVESNKKLGYSSQQSDQNYEEKEVVTGVDSIKIGYSEQKISLEETLEEVKILKEESLIEQTPQKLDRTRKGRQAIPEEILRSLDREKRSLKKVIQMSSKKLSSPTKQFYVRGSASLSKKSFISPLKKSQKESEYKQDGEIFEGSSAKAEYPRASLEVIESNLAYLASQSSQIIPPNHKTLGLVESSLGFSASKENLLNRLGRLTKGSQNKLHDEEKLEKEERVEINEKVKHEEKNEDDEVFEKQQNNCFDLEPPDTRQNWNSLSQEINAEGPKKVILAAKFESLNQLGRGEKVKTSEQIQKESMKKYIPKDQKAKIIEKGEIEIRSIQPEPEERAPAKDSQGIITENQKESKPIQSPAKPTTNLKTIKITPPRSPPPSQPQPNEEETEEQYPSQSLIPTTPEYRNNLQISSISLLESNTDNRANTTSRILHNAEGYNTNPEILKSFQKRKEKFEQKLQSYMSKSRNSKSRSKVKDPIGKLQDRQKSKERLQSNKSLSKMHSSQKKRRFRAAVSTLSQNNSQQCFTPLRTSTTSRHIILVTESRKADKSLLDPETEIDVQISKKNQLLQSLEDCQDLSQAREEIEEGFVEKKVEAIEEKPKKVKEKVVKKKKSKKMDLSNLGGFDAIRQLRKIENHVSCYSRDRSRMDVLLFYCFWNIFNHLVCSHDPNLFQVLRQEEA